MKITQMWKTSHMTTIDDKQNILSYLNTLIRWRNHQETLIYEHISIPSVAQCDRAAADLFTSVRDWYRQICTYTSGRKTLGWTLKSTMFIIVQFFYKRGWYHCIFNPRQGNTIWGEMVVRTILARTQETQGQVVDIQEYNHTSSSTKNNPPHKLLISPPLSSTDEGH